MLKRLTPETIQWILHLLDEGENPERIAAKLKLTAELVSVIADERRGDGQAAQFRKHHGPEHANKKFTHSRY